MFISDTAHKALWTVMTEKENLKKIKQNIVILPYAEFPVINLPPIGA